MARKPSPWFWAQLGEWCVTIGGKRRRLGPNPEGLPPPSRSRGKWVVPKAIDEAFHQIMAKVPDSEPSIATVTGVFELFLDWTARHRAAGTLVWYQKHLISFRDSLRPKSLKAEAVRAHHVDHWIDSHGWTGSYARGAMTAVARALNWAHRKGHLSVNPIRGRLDKPVAVKREVVIEFSVYERMLEAANGRFRDLLETAWETGCRPQEIVRVEARHVEIRNARWVFPVSESKGKRHKRIVYLSPTALEITKRLMREFPVGPIFRRPCGGSWSRHDVSQHLQRISKRLGAKYRLYDFRHTYVTRALKNGVDPVTLANLVGHVDLKMIHGIYSHISQDAEFMRQAAARAIGATPSCTST